MTYDLTLFNSTNARTNLDLVEGVNTASGGLFIVMLLFVIYLILFITLNKAGLDMIDNLIATSFLTSAIGVVLFLAQLLDWSYIMIPFSIFLLSLIVKFAR